MQLSPVYGADPLLALDGPPAHVLAPTVRQRRRLVAALEQLDGDDWNRASRCAGWTVRDVIVHLDSTNSFWSFSIAAGVAGSPTRFLATFDPVASPAELVAGSDEAPSEVLARFAASTEALVGQLEALDDEAWVALAEAPPGHVSVGAVVHHALWDSWVHERDILLPLGVVPEVEPDEVAAALTYAACLSPALSVALGRAGTGVLGVSVTEPHLELTVEVGDRVHAHEGPAEAADLVLTGDAVELLEALSVRRELDQDIPVDSEWLVVGLLEAFDVATDRRPTR